MASDEQLDVMTSSPLTKWNRSRNCKWEMEI